jgi:rhodanese-related sulfurtransferase
MRAFIFGFGLALSVFWTSSFAGNYQPVNVSKLPEYKQTTLGLYVPAPEAFKMKTEGGSKVMFVDVRTRGEFLFVGSAPIVDQNIPYMEMEDPVSWDNKNNRYTLSPNSDFVSAVSELATRMGLDKNSTIILICRSGDRSSLAANLLKLAGYTKVYSVVDGFEGDMSPKGRRDVNGWKNADLPWGYVMKETQADLR